MSVLNNSNAIETGGYNIDRSLRFRSSASAYLNRTPASAGNRKTWTVNGWVKRGQLGATQFLIDATAGTGTRLYFSSSDNLQFDSGGSGVFTTSQVFRDPSAWYMVTLAVDTTQATASNRVKLYINGSQITAFSATAYPSQNTDTDWNNTVAHYIGRNGNASVSYLDGYLAEFNAIDGQALTSSSFGETDTTTGVWVPKKYGGTYGTNGFYLPFSDNTSATTLAYDKSGNGNNWTANNISTTAGSTYDSMLDVPTLTSATAANFCTWNPINKHSSLDIREGNLYIYTGTTAEGTLGTLGVSSGKWYFEFYPQATTGGWPKIGIAPSGTNANATDGIFNTGYAYAANGTKRSPGSDVSYAASYSSGDIIGVALDMDAGTLTFYKNNTSQGTAFTGLSGTFSPAIMMYGGSYINFGQRSFSYTPPTGFVALNTFNLPDPTIKKPNQYMDVSLFTGTDASQNVTGINFQPDLVWRKGRSAAEGNLLADAVRGAGVALVSNNTNAEVSSNAVTSFNSNGFTTIGSNGVTYVGWQWKESATAGFDIVAYTGDGSQPRQINHNLGVAPKFIITKSRSSGGYDWNCWFTGFSNNQYIALNSTAAKGTDANTFPSAAGMTSTYFTIGSGAWINGNGTTYVAYLFAEIPGFSKFGSYTGNGSTDGPFVYCGFRPKYVMVKGSSYASGWEIIDTTRAPYNVNDVSLRANSSGAEVSGMQTPDILSNGFKLRGINGYTNDAQTYIFAAFAESPFKTSLAR